MIPHKLQLKNFLSYGATLQTIDFSFHHLICLSGKNGHGKSALLDAITWATWGQARKISEAVRADDGLLRIGETNMVVIFDFDCNNQRYRIKREYTRTKTKAIMNLDFGIINSTTQEYSSLTEKTVRTTQRCIEETLRIDFDSFVNSVFLRQSNANEFSRKSPKGRKEILATILGLDKYETIRKLAMEKIRTLQTDSTALTTLHQTYEAEKQQLNVTLEYKSSLQQQLQALESRQQELAFLNQELETLKKTLNTCRQEYETAHTQISQYKEQEAIRINELKEQFFKWRAVHKARISKTDLLAWQQERTVLTESLRAHQTAFQEQLSCKEKLIAVKEALHAQEHLHAHTIADSVQKEETRLEQLKRELHTNESILKNTLLEITKHTHELEKIDTALTKHIASKPHAEVDLAHITMNELLLEKRKCVYQQFIAQHNYLRTQATELQQKDALVHNENDPSCPLCEQNLSASRRRFLKKKFSDAQQKTVHRFNRLKRIIPLLKDSLIKQHESLASLRQKNIVLQEWNRQREDLEQKKQQHQQIITTVQENINLHQQAIVHHTSAIQKLQEEIDAVRTRIASNYSPEHQSLIKQLDTINTQLQSINYNQHNHLQTEKSLSHINQLITQREQLMGSNLQQQDRVSAISSILMHLRSIRTLEKDARNKIQSISSLDQLQSDIQSKEATLEKEKTLWQKEKEQIQHEYGKIEAQESLFQKKSIECARIATSLHDMRTLLNDYQAIAQATGKDGIQALLIDDAIPEIEHEANLLLSRLTDNQSQLFIESLKDLKKGGTKETLDIKIADPVGIRPYELFSGGEAFRIDFALRIAISKLLARRAGTTLQTLIIDEGFGSQDDEGLLHIMDSIYKIQDDFAKIIIVSHLTALKDQFPVHFVVEKRPQGSTICVVEQD